MYEWVTTSASHDPDYKKLGAEITFFEEYLLLENLDDGRSSGVDDEPATFARGAHGVWMRFTRDGRVFSHTILLSEFTAIRKRLDHGVAALDRGPRGVAPSCAEHNPRAESRSDDNDAKSEK
jgi:hypothetical protein